MARTLRLLVAAAAAASCSWIEAAYDANDTPPTPTGAPAVTPPREEVLAVDAADPSAGPRSGGTPVIVTLLGGGTGALIPSGPDGGLFCAFDEKDNATAIDVPAEWLSSSALLCNTPQWRGHGAIVNLSVRGGGHLSTSVAFQFYDDPVFESVYPSLGSSTGGTVVTLLGAGFVPLPKFSCRFGDQRAAATWISENKVSCTSPEGMAGSTVVLSLSLNGVDYIASPYTFRYIEDPAVQSIWPVQGHKGTNITVTGEAFERTNDLKCVFEMNDATVSTRARWHSTTTLTCIAPPVHHHPTRSTLRVTTNGIDLSQSGANFEHIEATVLTSIHPFRGPSVGGTWISVFGSGMREGLHCLFGGSPVQSYYVDSGEVQCLTPAATRSGGSNVTVTVSSQVAAATGMAEFQYYDHPKITSTTPAFGSKHGGTPVRLIGSGFSSSPDIHCRFGSSVVEATFVSDAEITCASPIGVAGTAQEVSVSLNSVNYIRAPAEFAYREPVILQSVQPHWVEVSGGATLSISGSNFEDTSDLSCIFSDDLSGSTNRVRAEYLSSVEVTCKSPPSPTSSTELALAVTSNGVDVSLNSLKLEVVDRPLITSVRPPHGYVNDQILVEILGNGLVKSGTNCCRFGDSTEMNATWVTNQTVYCATPPNWSSTGTVDVHYSNDGHNFESLASGFSFRVPVAINDVVPRAAPREGGTEVRVFGQNFVVEDEWQCMFGSQAVPADVISTSELMCVTRGTDEDVVPLSIKDSAKFSLQTEVAFQFRENIVLKSVVPTLVPSTGKSVITTELHGLGVDVQYECVFGGDREGASNPAIMINSTFLECTVPPRTPRNETNELALFIRSSDDVFVSEAMHLTVYDPPVFADVAPRNFSVDESFTEIIVFADSFVDAPEYNCRLGRHDLEAHRVTRKEVVCLHIRDATTTLQPLNESLQVSANGQDYHDTGVRIVAFSRLEPVAITCNEGRTNETADTVDDLKTTKRRSSARVSRILPALGLPRQTDVTVIGTGFEFLPNPVCSFGEDEVPAERVSNTMLTCGAPFAPTLKTVDFVVLDRARQVDVSMGSNLTFSFVERPSINTVYPAIIVAESTQTLTVNGEGLALLSGARCRLGSLRVEAVHVGGAQHQLKCTFYGSLKLGQYQLEVLSTFGIITSSLVQVIAQPELIRIEPRIAVAGANRTITVEGGGFVDTADTECFFDDFPSRAVVISRGEMLCSLPSHVRAKNYLVRMSIAGVLGRGFATMQVVEPASIASLIPSVGERGTLVTVVGKSFHPDMKCRYGRYGAHRHVGPEYVNSTQIRCIVPMDLPDAPIELGLSLANDTASSTSQTFKPIDLSIASTSPSFGDVNGGTPVRLDLQDPEAAQFVTHCFFAQTVVPVSSVGSRSVICSSPQSEEGPCELKVGTTAEHPSIDSSQFDFKAIQFTSMEPLSGPDTGGPLRVTGSGFVVGKDNSTIQLVPVIGREPASHYTFKSCTASVSTSINCYVGETMPGVYQMWMSLNGVDALDSGLLFEVYPRMTTLFSLPSFGSLDGGTRVNVHGANYRSQDMLGCQFSNPWASNETVADRKIVPATFVNSNLIECTTPSWGVADLAELTIISGSRLDSSYHDDYESLLAFAFVRPFELHSIEPNNGFVAGETDVVINGNHFSDVHGAVACVFRLSSIEASAFASVEATLVSDSIVACSTPEAPSTGVADVSLVYGGDEFHLRGAFTFEEDLVLATISPSTISSMTDKSVAVTGATFRSSPELVCDLSGTLIEAEYIHKSEVVCRIPSMLRPGKYNLSVSNNGQDFSNALEFRVFDSFLLTSIYPALGFRDRAINLTLHGQSLEDLGLECLFNSHFVAPADYVNSSIACPMIPTRFDGNPTEVSVELTLNGEVVSRGVPLFYSIVDFSVDSIFPTSGAIAGGTPVTVTLRHKGSERFVRWCHFGDSKVPAVTRRDGLICPSPRSTFAGDVKIGLGFDESNVHTTNSTFTYVPQPLFSRMEPTNGPELGNTLVVIAGDGFVDSEGLGCYFGDKLVAGVLKSGSEVMCATPPMKPGRYTVRITSNGVDTMRIPWQFTFDNAVDVLRVSPSHGSVEGGTQLSVLGKGFIDTATDSLACRFTPASLITRAIFVSSSEVICDTPKVGKTDSWTGVGIEISLNGLDFATAAAPYTYVPPARITSIEPTEGPTRGGTVVHVRGNNFHSTDHLPRCIFGGKSVNAVLVSASEMFCASPPRGMTGLVTFDVTLNGQDYICNTRDAFGGTCLDSPHVFGYHSTANLLSIDPTSGPFTGQTTVNVKGNFHYGSEFKCRFGDETVTAKFVDETSVDCVTPPHPPGLFPFILETDGENTRSTLVFEFYQPPIAYIAEPIRGHHAGGTAVQIKGQYFRQESQYKCVFDDTKEVSANFVSHDTISCVTPPSSEDEQGSTVVGLDIVDDSGHTAGKLEFLYTPPPRLDMLRPRYVFGDGTDVITVTVTNNTGISAEDSWRCRFTVSQASKLLVVEAEISRAGEIVCAVPSLYVHGPTLAFVELSFNGQDWSTSHLAVTYIPVPRLDSLYPSSGSALGGTELTISGAGFEGEGLTCLFRASDGATAEIFEARAISSSPTEVQCITPSVNYPLDTVVVLKYEGSSMLLEKAGLSYSFHRPLVLNQLFPTRGFARGGTDVTLSGTGFLDLDSLICRFGEMTVPARYLSANAVECPSPSVEDNDSFLSGKREVRLSVSLNGVDFSEAGVFSYDEEVELQSIQPPHVPVASNWTERHLALIGSNFVDTAVAFCHFENTRTPAVFVSQSEIRCDRPASPRVGKQKVRMSYNGVDTSSDFALLGIVERAVISDIRPGKVQEGAEVELFVKGTNFLYTPDLRCHFSSGAENSGFNLASMAKWIDDSALTCKTPRRMNMTHEGRALVSVSDNGGHDHSNFISIEVTARSNFVSMEPSLGYTECGTTISLRLGNVRFYDNLSCHFSGISSVPARVESANEIVCIAPPHSGETQAVEVRLMSDMIHTLAVSSFEYMSPPIIRSILPGVGPLGGGTSISVFGAGLSNVTHCKFVIDSSTATLVQAQTQSDFSLTCVTPHLSDREADSLVQVSHNGQDFVGDAWFLYRSKPRLRSLSPSFGSDSGGKLIHIHGENFMSSSLTMCEFGHDQKVLVDATYISSTLLSCESPTLPIGRHSVRVTLNGIDFSNSLEYESIALPQIESIHPNFGIVGLESNTVIQLRTTRLPTYHGLVCQWSNGTISPATRLGRNLASCMAPPGLDTKSATEVSLSINEESYDDRTMEFLFVEEPRIISITPAVGVSGSAVEVMVTVQNLEPFLPFNLTCSFGGSGMFEHASVQSKSVVACPLPANNREFQAPIVLRISDGVNARLLRSPGIFTYLKKMAITSVHPLVGTIRGGTRLVVEGSNFANITDLMCTFGSEASRPLFVADDEVHCLSPEWKGGPRTVDVGMSINEVGSLFHSQSSFEYRQHPVITDTENRFGGADGGTVVLLKGLSLDWGAEQYSCQFGEGLSRYPAIYSEEGLACASPPLDTLEVGDAPAEVAVTLFTADGLQRLARSDLPFVYSQEIQVLSLTPDSGPCPGGTAVEVKAQGLEAIPVGAITCHFGDSLVDQAVFVDLVSNVFSFRCVAPAFAGILDVQTHKTLLVTLGINGTSEVSSTGAQFTYYTTPHVTSISPGVGFVSGGEEVRVEGNYFRSTASCKFGEELSPKAVFLSPSSMICVSPWALPHMASTRVPIRVTNNDKDYTVGSKVSLYRYILHPDASSVEPAKLSWNVPSPITIKGHHMRHVTACRYGELQQSFPTHNMTKNTIQCEVPSAGALLAYSPTIPRLTLPIYLEMENGLFPAGLNVTFDSLEPEMAPRVIPTVTAVVPGQGSSSGGRWIVARGENFTNSGRLSCWFGEVLSPETIFVSFNEARCKSPPHVPGRVSFRITNGDDEECDDGGISSDLEYTYTMDWSIVSVYPRRGSIRGGNELRILGSFPVIAGSEHSASISCRFGSSAVSRGTWSHQNEIKCVTPPMGEPQTVELRLDHSGSGEESSTWFTYEYEIEIESVVPDYGYLTGNSAVLLNGKNFHGPNLKCLFGSVAVRATFISKRRLRCLHPPFDPASMDGSTVVLRVVSEDGYVGHSWKIFTYISPPEISSSHPKTGDAGYSNSTVRVEGTGFRNIMQLMCAFGGQASTQAHVIDSNTLLCDVPAHRPATVPFGLVDRFSNFSSPGDETAGLFSFVNKPATDRAIQTKSAWLISGTNLNQTKRVQCRFGPDLTSSATVLSNNLVVCPSREGTRQLAVVDIHDDGWKSVGEAAIMDTTSLTSPPQAPNGTTFHDHNVTLCEPGRFQPQRGQSQCLPCPVGFICPFFGLSLPKPCPPGYICDRLGLTAPSSACPAGHACLAGTKVAFAMADGPTEEWSLDEESGVLTANMNQSAFGFISREDESRELFDSVGHPTGRQRIRHPPEDNQVVAKQPLACPIGHYCKAGVSSLTHEEGDSSTPQPCFNGFFCPRGSKTPEGSGACPSGYYCPTPTLAITCEAGHYCVGTGNIEPTACLPGTYSPTPGLSNCIACEVGFQCPGWGRTQPEPCQAGWVCDRQGISFPTKRCPSGFVCGEGTTTSLALALTQTGTPPRPCPPGQFCLDGVAHDVTMEWLPSLEAGAFAPQPCVEGFYCPTNSSTQFGEGKCFPGHYCPEGSVFPTKTHLGTFASEDGHIAPSLCLPGTYAPRLGQVRCSPCPAGSSCVGYGNSIPRVCGPGTYRSAADSIQCKNCPERTYSSASGLTDVSQCQPCPEGRVCSSRGISEVSAMGECPEGHVCGYATDRSTQNELDCPGGSYCSSGSTAANQYTNTCLSGVYCERGSIASDLRNKCSKGFYCVPATPLAEPTGTRCPAQTTCPGGSRAVEDCEPSLVAVCDKEMTGDNPFKQMSYYESRGHVGLETLVVDSILPMNDGSSQVVSWVNDTVEVFRSCPAYGSGLTGQNESSTGSLTIIGRNFQDTPTLTCRFRLCYGLGWTAEGGAEVIVPIPSCPDSTAHLQRSTMGVFVNTNRIHCPLPDFGSSRFVATGVQSDPDESPELCLLDEQNNTFLSKRCHESDLITGECVFEEAIPYFGLRRRIKSLYMSCTEEEVLKGYCSDTPVRSYKLNPCFVNSVTVEVSNSGKKFSGDMTAIPSSSFGWETEMAHEVFPTSALYSQLSEAFVQSIANVTAGPRLEQAMGEDSITCLASSDVEEGIRLDEQGWTEAPYMTRFHLSFDWRHLPSDLVYGKHYRLAIHVVPSRCSGSICTDDSQRSHARVENIPCLQPIDLPVWFTDPSVDKHQIMNLTLTTLDDARFRVQVQIVDGFALPAAPFFKNTMSVFAKRPERANTEMKRTRKLSPLVSWEERNVQDVYLHGIRYARISHIYLPLPVPKSSSLYRYDEHHSQTITPPLNLPPRWEDFRKGRVLAGMNSTKGNRQVPTIKDGNQTRYASLDFWDNPHTSAIASKRKSDHYFETFHGSYFDASSGSHQYDHNALILPYLPYFSNCHEFDSYVPLWAVVESQTECNLPGISDEYPEDWWRRRIAPLPHVDDVTAIGPTDFWRFYPIADICERRLHCTFEENLSQAEVTPRWFEADSGTVLFSIIRDPIDFYQYTGRNETVAGIHDGGGQKYLDSITTLQEFVNVKVDRSPALNVDADEGCITGCFPRRVTLDISYYQVDADSKRIVEANVYYDRFDKDESSDEYELQIKFHALNYQELVIKFAFSHELFMAIFSQIGVCTVVAALVYWIVVRLTTNLEQPPRLRLLSFLVLTVPPAVKGFVLALMPIIVNTSAVYFLIKGYLVLSQGSDPDGRNWLFLSRTRLEYSDVTIDPGKSADGYIAHHCNLARHFSEQSSFADLLQSTQQGRAGLAFLAMSVTALLLTAQVFVPKVERGAGVDEKELAYKRGLVGWKRSNLVCSSIVMSLFLVIIVEWSFWSSFGTYIWEAIIFMKILSVILGNVVDKQLGDALLSGPVMTAMGMIQGIGT